MKVRSLLFLCVFVVSSLASAQTVVSVSDFKGNENVIRSENIHGLHQPDGTTWAESVCPASMKDSNGWGWKAAYGKDWASPTNSYIGRCEYLATPPVGLSPNYYVDALIENAPSGTSNLFFAVLLRSTPDGSTHYGVGFYRFSTAPDSFIWKRVDDVTTIMASGDCNIWAWRDLNPDRNNLPDVMRATVHGDFVSMHRQADLAGEFLPCPGLTNIAMGNAITQAGQPGMGMGAYLQSVDRQSSALGLGSFTVVDFGGGPTPTPPTFTADGSACPETAGLVEFLLGKLGLAVPLTAPGHCTIVITNPSH